MEGEDLYLGYEWKVLEALKKNYGTYFNAIIEFKLLKIVNIYIRNVFFKVNSSDFTRASSLFLYLLFGRCCWHWFWLNDSYVDDKHW